MLPEKVREQKARDREWHGRKLRCTLCGAIMRDCEPAQESGEFWHPDNCCINSGRQFDWEPPATTGNARTYRGRAQLHAHGIEQLWDKKTRRARKRGAKLARKYRA